MHYQVIGVGATGRQTLVRTAQSAREAQRFRDLGDSPWAQIIVIGSEGELTASELDRLAALDHQYV